METQDYLNKADRAIAATVVEVNEELRQHLIDSNYPPKAADSVQVFHDGDDLDFRFEGAGADTAQTIEYGNEKTPPQGSIRKFFNDTSRIEEIYMKNLEKSLGDLV